MNATDDQIEKLRSLEDPFSTTWIAVEPPSSRDTKFSEIIDILSLQAARGEINWSTDPLVEEAIRRIEKRPDTRTPDEIKRDDIIYKKWSDVTPEEKQWLRDQDEARRKHLDDLWNEQKRKREVDEAIVYALMQVYIDAGTMPWDGIYNKIVDYLVKKLPCDHLVSKAIDWIVDHIPEMPHGKGNL
jgi:hypothetical protein